MDYETKPTSRQDIRKYAKILRRIFGIPEDGPFPVLEALEKVHDVFKGSGFVIVEDSKLPAKTMAQCSQNDEGGYTIQIKESIYWGAYEKHIGAFLGFICHEICHLFLFYIGFTPIHARTFDDGELPRYCSVEWQCKALTGELMIPFDKSHGMSEDEIVSKYGVSKAFAKVRRSQERRWGH